MFLESGAAIPHISQARIVIEAECSRCGPILPAQDEGLRTLEAATAHTNSTGHLVILNGTIDAPELDELDPLPSCTEGDKP